MPTATTSCRLGVGLRSARLMPTTAEQGLGSAGCAQGRPRSRRASQAQTDQRRRLLKNSAVSHGFEDGK